MADLICYKVLHRRVDKLYSYTKHIFDSPNELEYKEHQWTKPKVGKLFVFKSYKDAKQISNEVSLEIWEVYAENVKNIHYCSYGFSSLALKQFWAGEIKSEHCAVPPKGTYVCDRLLLIKQKA